MQYRVVRADFLNWVRLAVVAVERGLMQPFHAVLCDPPYGIGMMDAHWDTFRPGQWRKGSIHRAGGLGGYRAAPTWSEMTPDQMRAYQEWVTTWATPLTRVVHPGALGFFFGGTRTVHRLAAGLENGGWTVRGQIAWLYGSGMVKGLDVAKDLDQSAFTAWLDAISHDLSAEQRRAVIRAAVRGISPDYVGEGRPAEPPDDERLRLLLELIERFCGPDELPPGVRLVTGRYHPPNGQPWNLRQADESSVTAAPGAFTASGRRTLDRTGPATEAARQWHGWHTALAPSHEVVVVAQSPYPAGMRRRDLAQEHGTGAYWVDGARLPGSPLHHDEAGRPAGERSWIGGDTVWTSHPGGRWPPDVAISEGIAEALGEQAAYFYCAKAPTWEREAGLDDLPLVEAVCGLSGSRDGSLVTNRRCARCGCWKWSWPGGTPCTCADPIWEKRDSRPAPRRNDHQTVKPVRLAEWLSRLLLPPPHRAPRRLLIPFGGTGSEGIGALLAGWGEVRMVEREERFVEMARRRLAWWSRFCSYEEAERAYGAIRHAEKERQREREAGQLDLFAIAGESIEG